MTAESRGRQDRQPVRMHDSYILSFLILDAADVLGLGAMLTQLRLPSRVYM